MFFLSRKIKNWSLNYCFWNEIIPCLYLLCWDMLVKIDKNNKETRIAVISLQISNISFVILQTFFISQLFVNVFTFLHKKGLYRYFQHTFYYWKVLPIQNGFLWTVCLICQDHWYILTFTQSKLITLNSVSLYKWCGFLLQTQWRKF